MKKNDVQIINEWQEANKHMQYDMESMTRKDDLVIMRFRSAVDHTRWARIMQARIPYVGIGEMTITEYNGGEIVTRALR